MSYSLQRDLVFLFISKKKKQGRGNRKAKNMHSCSKDVLSLIDSGVKSFLKDGARVITFSNSIHSLFKKIKSIGKKQKTKT